MLKKYIGLAVVAFLIIAQFFRIDKTNPTFEPSSDFITVENTSELMSERLKSTCYDCHSHETKYPWYSNIAPVSWWVKSHINNGKKHLNYSEWGQYSIKKKIHKLEESIEYTEKGWMPLKSYTWMHGNANMSEEERGALVSYFKALKAQLESQ